MNCQNNLYNVGTGKDISIADLAHNPSQHTVGHNGKIIWDN